MTLTSSILSNDLASLTRQRGVAQLQLLAALLIGITSGGFMYHWFLQDMSVGDTDDKVSEPVPIYWVAPMDANYRRDKPGKSPMGMDLVPVYASDNDTGTGGPGAIQIDPSVVNNLGVRTARVSQRKLASSLRTVGYVKYDEDKLIHIHPRVAGWIERLHVTSAGARVSQGQALYSLYSPELVNAQEELLLALNRQNTRLINAAEDRLLALQLSADFIATLKREGTVRQTVTFRSSRGGVVDKLNIREGFYVTPDTTLMSLGSIDNVWVEAEVFERQAGRVQVGMDATMTLEYLPGRTWQGQVDYIYPTLDQNTRTLRLRLRFANEDQLLKPNMFAQVILHASSELQSLAIPRESLIRTGNQDRVVLALGEGRFKSVAVSVGRIENRYAEILAGLHEGDTVVSSAQFLLDSESSKISDFQRMSAGPVGESAEDLHHD